DPECVVDTVAGADRFGRRFAVSRHGPNLPVYRMGPNAARSSSVNRAGCSHAAKWPPRSTSWKYDNVGNARRAHVSGGLYTSSGNTVSATGTLMSVVMCGAETTTGLPWFSQYKRLVEAALLVSQ